MWIDTCQSTICISCGGVLSTRYSSKLSSTKHTIVKVLTNSRKQAARAPGLLYGAPIRARSRNDNRCSRTKITNGQHFHVSCTHWMLRTCFYSIRHIATSLQLPGDVTSAIHIGKAQDSHGSISGHAWMILFTVILPIIHLEEAADDPSHSTTLFAHWLEGNL